MMSILVAVCAFGVAVAFIGVINESRRRKQAKKDWEEFEQTRTKK